MLGYWGNCISTLLEIARLSITITVYRSSQHHKTPRAKGGKDGYNNLVLILEDVHKLVHSTKKSTIDFYLGLLKLNDKQLKKLNHLRELAGLPAMSREQ